MGNSSNSNSSSSSNSNSYVKGNLLTLLLSAIVVIIAVMLNLSIELAFMIWLSSFLLDASYTFHKRKLLKQYELNILVRRSDNIVVAFVKVVVVEFALIALLSLLLFFLTLEDTAVSAMFIFFAVVHVMAFARSYKYMKKLEK